MRRLIYTSCGLVLLSILCADYAEAQRRRYKRPANDRNIAKYKGGRVNDLRGEAKNVFVGVSINAMNYFGDITPLPKRLSTDIGFTRSGFGVEIGKKFHPNASARIGFNYGKIEASDFDTADPTEGSSGLGRYQRNLSFENTITELSLGFEFDLFPNYGGIGSRFNINPYIFIGLAGFTHDPKAIAPANDLFGNPLAEAGQLVSLRDLGTEGQNTGIDSLPGKYSKIQLAIPVGIGVKAKLLTNLDVQLEFGLRQLFTDYLDDVSGKDVELSLLDSELARALAERGTETTDVVSGDTRDTNFYSQVTYRSPHNGEVYNIGQEYSPGSVRGNIKDNDFYLVTQLRLVYYIQKGSKRRAKFR
ncbi:MAG: DUF6089 family protein [Cyclobacteriaceae bacterium]